MHPLALKTLAAHRVPTDGFSSKIITLKRRIQLMLSPPPATLDRIAIHKEINDIGRR